MEDLCFRLGDQSAVVLQHILREHLVFLVHWLSLAHRVSIGRMGPPL